jgi:hypothetical protein
MPHPVGCGLADSAEPYLRRCWATRTQPRNGLVVIIIELVFPAINVDRDELVIIGWTKQRAHLAVENLGPELS